MEEWKEYKLGEILNFRRGHDLPKTKMLKGNIPVAGSNGIIGFHNEYTPISPCITIGRSGNIGTPYIYKKCWAHNTVLYVDDFKGNDPLFLYYLLKTLPLESYAGGSAVPTLNRNHIHPIEVKFCKDINLQRRIASILSSLDDKIELNRRINANLEEQAQALFKSWFIDFEPFKDGKFVDSELGMIPEGWKVGCIGDYCNVRSGYAFKSSWWTEVGEKVVKIKNITNEGNLDMSDCSHVSKENTIKAGQFKVNGGDLLIAMTGATIGKFCIVPNLNEDLFVNQRVGKFFLGEKPIERLPFIYNNLKTQRVYQEIINKGQGSAQPNISGNDIESILIVFPPVNIIECFNKLIQPIYEKILTNTQQSLVLSQTRDTLLPKLMSGEIEIND